MSKVDLAVRDPERLRSALERSHAVVAHARVLVTVLRRHQDDELIVCCAWCGRYGDGDGHWDNVRWLGVIPGVRISASICPDCFADFQAE